MKKSISLLLALTCGLTCTFALAACGESGSNEDGYVNESPEVTEFEWTEYQTKIANAADIGGNCTVRLAARGDASALTGFELNTYDYFLKFDNENLRYQLLAVYSTSNGGDYEIQNAVTYDIKENKAYTDGTEIGELGMREDEDPNEVFATFACFISPLIGDMSNYMLTSNTMGRNCATNTTLLAWQGLSLPAGTVEIWWTDQTSGFEGFTSQCVAWIDIDLGLAAGGAADTNTLTIRPGDYYSTAVDVNAKSGDTFSKMYNT